MLGFLISVECSYCEDNPWVISSCVVCRDVCFEIKQTKQNCVVFFYCYFVRYNVSVKKVIFKTLNFSKYMFVWTNPGTFAIILNAFFCTTISFCLFCRDVVPHTRWQ